jgi:hypothetical protein
MEIIELHGPFVPICTGGLVASNRLEFEAPHPFYGYYGPELRIQESRGLKSWRCVSGRINRIVWIHGSYWILLDLTGCNWM